MDTGAGLIERAKRLAPPVVSCVQADIAPDHLLAGKSWKQLAALVIVLAEVADHEKLDALSRIPGDEGLPADLVAAIERRRTDAVVARLREEGRLADPPPDQRPVLRHEHETDLYPVIAVLAEALTGVPQVAARRSRQDQQETKEGTAA